MKFSLWQLLALLTGVALMVVWREELGLIFSPALNAFTLQLAIFGICVWLLGRSLAWYYSDNSPLWTIGRLASRCRKRPLLFSILRFCIGPYPLAYGIACQANEQLEAGDYEAAVRLAQVAVDLAPRSHAARSVRGLGHHALGEFGEAIVDYRVALEQRPQERTYRVYLAYSYLALGMYDETLSTLASHHCKEWADAQIAHIRGEAHASLEDWHAAINEYNLALQLDPNHEEATLALTIIHSACPLTQLRDGPSAIGAAKRICIRRSWNDWRSVSCLAAAYAEAGDFEHAIEFAKQALELAPKDEKPTRKDRLALYESGHPYRLESASAPSQTGE